jgi:hypothetical protein
MEPTAAELTALTPDLTTGCPAPPDCTRYGLTVPGVPNLG